MPDKDKQELIFGDYVSIEMKCHGVPNQYYTHKVIGTLNSNTWVDVPVQGPAEETIHSEIVAVVACIVCGVQETTVLKYRLQDVKYSHSEYESKKQEWQREAGENVQQEIRRLGSRDGNAKIKLLEPTDNDPFLLTELEVVDFGVSDNAYIVKRKQDDRTRS